MFAPARFVAGARRVGFSVSRLLSSSKARVRVMPALRASVPSVAAPAVPMSRGFSSLTWSRPAPALLRPAALFAPLKALAVRARAPSSAAAVVAPQVARRSFTTSFVPLMADKFKAEPADATAATPAPTKPTSAAVMTPAAKDLAQHLNDEYKQEEVPDAPAVPDGWQLKDYKGESYLYLKREMGDERITIRMEIDPPDTNTPDENEERWSEEEQNSQQEEQQQDQEEQEEEEGGQEDDQVVLFEVIVSKPKVHSGAIVFQIGGDSNTGEFMMNRVVFTDAISALEVSPQAELKRNSSYQGPAIGDMPVDSVNLMTDYLRERGVTEEMVKFLYDYAYYKEQREYVNWLKSLTVFLTAK